MAEKSTMHELKPPSGNQTFDPSYLCEEKSTKLELSSMRECYFTQISPTSMKIEQCKVISMTGGCVTIKNINDIFIRDDEVVRVKVPRIDVGASFVFDDSVAKDEAASPIEMEQCDAQSESEISAVEFTGSECSDHECTSEHSEDQNPDDELYHHDRPRNVPATWHCSGIKNEISAPTISMTPTPTPARSLRSVGTQINLDETARDNSQEIRVNATLHLPANVNQCSVNITATRTSPPAQQQQVPSPRARSPPPPYTDSLVPSSLFHTGCGSSSFHGGGIVNIGNLSARERMAFEEDMDHPDYYLRKLYNRLEVDRYVRNMKKVLDNCPFYYEDVSWQESTEILRNAEYGQWILRNSQNRKYDFAISVQTKSGPTSIRIVCVMGQYRLDSENHLTFEVPFFKCVLQLIQYYIEYSKTTETGRNVVWVDYNKSRFNQIYLSERPVYKKVPSLTHLARLNINKHQLSTVQLPEALQKYCKEYPYAF